MPGKQQTLKRISSPVRKDFEGEIVKPKDLVDCDFIIHDFVVIKNQYKEKDSDPEFVALTQIELEKEMRVTFLSNPYLIELMEKYRNNGDLPALATLRKGQGEGKKFYYYFE